MLSPLETSAFAVINYLATTKFGVSFFDGLGLSDVWVSYKVNGVWSKPHNLNDVPGEPPVNTVFHDHCLSFSVDGNEAFWTSTRPGGFGGNDIWTSRRLDGKWTQPENLGHNVNGPGNDRCPVWTPDGRIFIFDSNRAGGYGSRDLWWVYSRDVTIAENKK